MFSKLPQIGKVIKACRIQKGLTQSQLAEQINLTFRQLSAIENDRSYPKFETLVSLVQILNIPPSQIFDIENNCHEDAERFYELLLSCDDEDRKTVIATASTLIQQLKGTKRK